MFGWQVCCASSRTFVHESIYERFVAASAQRAKARVVGSPWLEQTQHTAQVDDTQFQKVLGYIESGKQEGAHLVAGGKRVGNQGLAHIEFLYSPT